jgi:hypothetical protein
MNKLATSAIFAGRPSGAWVAGAARAVRALPFLCELYLKDIDQLAMVFLPLYWGHPKDCIWFRMHVEMAPER